MDGSAQEAKLQDGIAGRCTVKHCKAETRFVMNACLEDVEGNHAAVVDVAHEHKGLPPAPVPAAKTSTGPH